ncbi:MAG: hypothetical protein EA423_04300 [Phycisphaerales bacterium]|nr:MAG: hypothetical protein EA423_04300 [Phycisphaerales bacterium]
MKRNHARTLGLAGLATAALTFSALALAQPEGAGGERSAESAQQRPELTRAQLQRQREETQQRIEMLQQRLSRIDGALERLGDDDAREAAGTDQPQTVQSEARELPRDRLRRMEQRRTESAENLQTDPRAELLDTIAAESPELASRLRRLRTEDPDEFGQLLRRIGPRYRELTELRAEDPQLAALRAREMAAGLAMASSTRQLAAAVRSEDDRAAEEARVAVMRALERSFDAREASARLEMSRLRERLGAMESEVQDRRNRRDAIIAEQMRRIEQSLDRLVEREPPQRDGGRRPRRGGGGG